jgi:predicted GNAT superfamily acetyltransferase
VQLGFVFGITGVEDGEAVHWSHMLGVRASARDQGVGRKLKELQRAELLRRRIRRMYWTFDPLQARNAHLNINRLGVRVVEYVRDMYGTSLSPLHHAVGTDRLVVESHTEVNGHAPPQHENGRLAEAQVLSAFPQAGELPAPGRDLAVALIEIPWDLQAVVAESVQTAGAWRAATRRYFQWALANGYEVTGVRRDEAARRVFFVIERAAASS